VLASSTAFDAARSRSSCQIKVTAAFEGLRVTVAPSAP
jgi:hypothetical protein